MSLPRPHDDPVQERPLLNLDFQAVMFSDSGYFQDSSHMEAVKADSSTKTQTDKAISATSREEL